MKRITDVIRKFLFFYFSITVPMSEVTVIFISQLTRLQVYYTDAFFD